MVEKFHRDAQTVKTTTCSIQSSREAGAQTKRPGLFLDETTDKVLVARPYFDAEEHSKLRLQKTLIVQCFVRGWFARRAARRMREELERRHRERAEREANEREAAEAHRQRELDRRMHPKTKEDFDILYRELEGLFLSVCFA